MRDLRPSPPRWFTVARWAALILYLLAAIACGAATMAMGAVKTFVYRDFTRYTFIGDPWGDSGLPWYVGWRYRLGEGLAAVTVLAALFWAFYIAYRLVFVLVFPFRTRVSVHGRIAAATILAILTELAMAAWLGHWFG
jgi:hypothetical protein